MASIANNKLYGTVSVPKLTITAFLVRLSVSNASRQTPRIQCHSLLSISRILPKINAFKMLLIIILYLPHSQNYILTQYLQT